MSKRCEVCDALPSYEDALCRSDVPCARLAMYETAKLPQSWQQKCRQFDGDYITTNADIQTAMQEEIDGLRAYAARLACDLLALNGMIQKAARDAEGYMGAVRKAGKETA